MRIKFLPLLLVPFLLVGCAETVTESSADESMSVDEMYLSVVRDAAPESAVLDDADLIEMAHLTCELFDAGGTFEDAAMVAFESGTSPELAGSIYGAGVAAYCPEYSHLIG